MSIPTFASTPRPSSRRARQRQKTRRIIFWVVSVLLVLWAFGAGVLWRRLEVRWQTAARQPPELTETQRLSARHLLDEAVRARHEGQMDDAMAQLATAQQADPQLPGLELLAGEIALQQRDTDALSRASANASQRGDSEASAKLLAALGVWLRRGELGVERAGLQAKQLLREAAESSPSEASVHFFQGELNRQLGDGFAAHRHLLSALWRQVPWRSSSLLRFKMQMAAAEAAEGGEKIEVPAPDVQSAAALRWRNALRAGTGEEEALGAMIALTPSLQTIFIMDDTALADGDEAMSIESLRRQLGNAVMPGGATRGFSP